MLLHEAEKIRLVLSGFVCFVCVFVTASVQRQCSTLSNDRRFLLDMLYSRTNSTASTAAPDTNEEEANFPPGREVCFMRFRTNRPAR